MIHLYIDRRFQSNLHVDWLALRWIRTQSIGPRGHPSRANLWKPPIICKSRWQRRHVHPERRVYADGSTYLLTVSKRGNPDFKVTYIAPCPTCIATGAIITFNITTNFDVAPLIDTQINSPGGYYLGGLSATNEVDTVGFSFHDHSYAQASISVSLCSFTADVC